MEKVSDRLTYQVQLEANGNIQQFDIQKKNNEWENYQIVNPFIKKQIIKWMNIKPRIDTQIPIKNYKQKW